MMRIFEKHYKIYSSLEEGFERKKHPFNFGFYHSFKEGEKIMRGDIVEGLADYLIKGRCPMFAMGRKGYRFSEKDFTLSSKAECCCGKVKPKKKCFYRSGSFKHDFLVFDDEVFDYLVSLPLEQQNPTVNKFILKNVEDYLVHQHLLINEYQNKGKHFEEYFSYLSPEDKIKLVRKLNLLDNHNNVKINSFIRGQGFDIGSLDYLILYKENNEGFIQYFKSRCDSEKKVILSNIMDSDFINEKVIDWLNEHYSDLVSEVRFSR